MRISDWSSDVCSSDLGIDFVRPTDFADHDHCVGIGIVVEHLQHVDVLQAIDGVATNTHSGRLAQAQFSQLRHSFVCQRAGAADRSEEHTSELQSLMRISYAVFCLKKKNTNTTIDHS